MQLSSLQRKDQGTGAHHVEKSGSSESLFNLEYTLYRNQNSQQRQTHGQPSDSLHSTAEAYFSQQA